MKPERIIFFRDGVSEGQFRAVQRAEVPQIIACCQELGRASGEDYSPPVSACHCAPALLHTSRRISCRGDLSPSLRFGALFSSRLFSREVVCQWLPH